MAEKAAGDRFRPKFRAKVRFARISPRKLRDVVNMIRGKDYNSAVAILRSCSRRGAVFCRKVLDSAMSNATSIISSPGSVRKRRDQYPPDALREIDVDNLHVVEARVDGGPILKRWRPSSMRRPTMIRKRFSHMEIVLQEREREPSRREKRRDRKRTAAKAGKGKKKKE